MDNYLTLRDLLHTAELEKSCEPYGISNLDKPVAVSERNSGVNKSFFDDSEPVYAVRFSRKISKKHDFDGWILEGLTKTEIKKMENTNGIDENGN